MGKLGSMKYISLFLAIYFSMLTISCNGQSIRHKLHPNYSEQKTGNNVLVIDSVIDLKGGSIELPACYQIVFEGEGTIRNGNVYVDLATYSIEGGLGIFDNVKLLPKGGVNNVKKSPIRELCAQWFGVTSSETYDNTTSLQSAIDAGHAFAIPVFLPRGYYRITGSLKLYEGDILKGESLGRITSENQRGATFIRYCGNGNEMISVEGSHVTVENLLIAGNTPYQADGFSLKKGAGLYFCLNNVLIVNTRYGVNCILDKNEGFSGCIWDKVSIWKCVRGLSVDINRINGQFITYNSFNNNIISAVLEKGVYFHCRAVNSSMFRDCIIERVGYGPGFNDNYVNSEIASIYVKNEAPQGSVNIDGGYYEDIYFSKDGEPAINYKESLSSVFNVHNMNLSIRDVRFANTRTIVHSKGLDNIVISNCIDNGYYRNKRLVDIPICLGNEKTVLEIDNYVQADNNKILYKTEQNGKIKSCEVRNIREKNN